MARVDPLGSADETGAASRRPQSERRDVGTMYEVVLVLYRSRELAESLLTRLGPDVPVVVVDNGRGVDGAQTLVEGRPLLRYLSGPGEGFAKAANLGARVSEAEYVLFVNPDSSPEVAQLEQLVDRLQADPALIAVGATTVLEDGRVELGVGGWQPSVARSVVHAFGLHKIWPTGGIYARPAPGRPMDVEWISGACMAVRRADFLALGGFDESFFVYNEDMAFGRRAARAGRGVLLCTDILVPHLGAGSGEAKPRMFQMRGASMYQYVRAANSAPSAQAIRVVLTVATALRVVATGLRRNTGLSRAHRAYIHGLWHGAPDMS